MKILLVIWNELVKYKKSLVLFMMISFLGWGTSLVMPVLSGCFINCLADRRGIGTIYVLTGWMGGVLLLDLIFSFMKNYMATSMKTRISFDLNYRILEHVKKLPLKFYSGVNTVYLNQRINTDACSVSFFVLDQFSGILISSVTLVFVTIYLFFASVKLSLFLLLLMPLYLLLYFMFNKPLYRTEYVYREKQNQFFSKMNEQIFHIRLVKINAWFEDLGQELQRVFESLYQSAMGFSKVSFFFSSSGQLINYLAKILLFAIGGMEVIHGRLTLGTFTVMNVYFSMLLDCVSCFLNFGKAYQSALVSYERIKEIMEKPPEHNGKEPMSNLSSITLRNVTFSHDGGKPLLNQFNFRFEKGRIYEISGKNGIGKSTLIDLILGLHPNYQGEILYNDKDIHHFDLYKLRKNVFGMTEQEPALFQDSIRNNITYGQSIRETEIISQWMQQFHFGNFIQKMPHKLDTIITEKCNVSGGEKQKIALLRTFFKDAQVMILDEPTSALDGRSVFEIKEHLNRMKHDKIIILITHGQELSDITDEVIYLSPIEKKTRVKAV